MDGFISGKLGYGHDTPINIMKFSFGSEFGDFIILILNFGFLILPPILPSTLYGLFTPILRFRGNSTCTYFDLRYCRAMRGSATSNQNNYGSSYL